MYLLLMAYWAKSSSWLQVHRFIRIRSEARATARLECLEESKEKEALLTLVRGASWPDRSVVFCLCLRVLSCLRDSTRPVGAVVLFWVRLVRLEPAWGRCCSFFWCAYLARHGVMCGGAWVEVLQCVVWGGDYGRAILLREEADSTSEYLKCADKAVRLSIGSYQSFLASTGRDSLFSREHAVQ